MEEAKDQEQTMTRTDHDTSLENQLKSRILKGLKPSTTKLTHFDGSISLLKNKGLEFDDSVKEKMSDVKSFGFVIDTKPDLSVGVVRPWLFVGSQDVPNDLTLIHKYHITHILSLLPDFELISSDPAVPSIVESHVCLEVYDEIGFDLFSPTVMKGLDFIHECYLRKKNILVHCNAGVSRAPSVVILYLMKYENMSFIEAWNMLKDVRPQTKLNDGFIKQLKSFCNTDS